MKSLAVGRDETVYRGIREDGESILLVDYRSSFFPSPGSSVWMIRDDGKFYLTRTVEIRSAL